MYSLDNRCAQCSMICANNFWGKKAANNVLFTMGIRKRQKLMTDALMNMCESMDEDANELSRRWVTEQYINDG